MTQQHPMVPPNILLNNWESDWFNERENVDVLLIQAYQAGADAELEKCVEWGNDYRNGLGRQLSAARRPKPPSLKEEALAVLDDASDRLDAVHENTIRRALEQLPDPS